MLFQKKQENKEEHKEEHHGLFGHKQEHEAPEHKEEHHGLFGHKQETPKQEHHGLFGKHENKEQDHVLFEHEKEQEHHKLFDKHENQKQEHHGLFGPKKEELKVPMKEEHQYFSSKNEDFSTGHVDDEPTLLSHLSSKKMESQIEAPLFVKVEKYNDLITILQEMKMFSSSVKNIYNVLAQIEAVRNDALNLMKISVQRLEKNVAEMDNELIRPRGIDMKPSRSELDVRHIEDSLEDLQKQLASLRTGLNQIQ